MPIMSDVDYNSMSDKELRQYFLKHRQNKEIFYAYMDRLNSRPRKVIGNVSDPDFDEKIQAAILQKIAEAERSEEAG